MISFRQRVLFGGAAMAAWIGPAASGQYLSWGDSAIGVYARDQTDFDPSDSESFTGSGNFSVAAETDFSSISASASAWGFQIECDSSDKDYVGATDQFSCTFQLDHDWLIILYWDLTAGQSWDWDGTPPSITVEDVTHGATLLTADKFANPDGIGELYLASGVEYRVSGGIAAFGGVGHSYFFMVPWIPAPGAASLLGLAAVGIARRHRA